MTIAIKPIIGSNGNDQLNGGNGHELLSGRGGNDLIITGNGHDVAYGGAGNDEKYTAILATTHSTEAADPLLSTSVVLPLPMITKAVSFFNRKVLATKTHWAATRSRPRD